MLEDYVESDYHATSIPPHWVPAKSSPSAVCWRWGAHAPGIWLEVDKYRPRVLLAFTFASATTRRGGASFEVGGLPTFAGVLLVDNWSSGWFSLFLASDCIRVCRPLMDRCWVFTALGGVLRPFSRHSLTLTDLCNKVVAFCYLDELTGCSPGCIPCPSCLVPLSCLLS